ncbi:Hypothetical protein Bdt_1372 [Bdellovibrio bacteriovorus str. Tiberius]|uniref:Uncharacterized protein n=1 Tax=Bdellovibrio bacteriovorus str. Tiberius TaxID=1069642 RepID=K7YWH9_BDEBC|nr:Hypothetical protein Bdt_1372 [Bdellovibrio bacteriovorus str. Tiberius]
MAGFVFGRWMPEASEFSLDLSSESVPSVNVIENLACPSEEKYHEMARKVSLVIPEGSEACDDSYRAKLGKILLLMDQLRIEAPADWLPSFQHDLGDLLGYVAKNSRRLNLDLNQTGSIAYNMSSEQSIYLGGYFFGSEPLEAISTLIHEARHSVSYSPRHVQCRGGDIPFSTGGCDARFGTTEKDAGAYSYEVLLQAGLAMYGKGLSPADKEFMMSSALTVLASRFNELPVEVSQKTDVLLALGRQGQVYVVDATAKSFKPIEMKLRSAGEKIQRLGFSPRNSGLILFSDKAHVYSWSIREGFKDYNPELIADMPVWDAARITIPGEINRTRHTFKTDGGIYKVSKLLAGKMKFELVDMIPAKDMTNYPAFESYFLAQYGDSVFLGADGGAWLLAHDTFSSDWFKKPEGLQDSRGWQQGTGGVLYEDLFLLTRTGELRVAKSFYEELDEYNSRTTYTTEAVDFKIPGRSVKYLQGLKIHGQLNDDGHLFLRPYGRAEQIELQGPDIVDFAIIHNPALKSPVVPHSSQK